MHQGRRETRTDNFDIGRFYENLHRIENSLGKTAPRNTASSLNKQPIHKPAEDDRIQNWNNFKRDLNNKNLTKAKIKLEQPYEKIKIKHTTQNEESLNASDNFKFLDEQSNAIPEDPFEKVRNKLLSWKSQEKKIQPACQIRESELSRLTNISNVLGNNKENIEYSLASNEQQSTDAIVQSYPSLQATNSQLLEQLSKRNNIYCYVREGLKQNQNKKSKQNIAFQLQDHFRQHTTMLKVIEKFKQLCGLNTTNLSQLLTFLKSGDHQPVSDSLLDSSQHSFSHQ